jgi:hypothetical protein
MVGAQMSELLKNLNLALNPQAHAQTGVDGKPVDKDSPEYKAALMQQLASTGPVGAMGSVGLTAANLYKDKQAQQAWAPTVTYGE